MPDHSRFAVFVLSHGRPGEVYTMTSLERHGYTGRTYLVVDDEDDTLEEYRRTFGADNVLTFSKAEAAKTFDQADTQDDRRTIVYARNACFGLARDLGLDYFLELDDDYRYFVHRWVDDDKVIRAIGIKDLDRVLDEMLTFSDVTGAAIVAMSQGGDHLGGIRGRFNRGLLRKAMNSLLCRTDRPVTFHGRINEDVNTYVVEGMRGRLFFTIMGLQLTQMPTQATGGGMTGLYLSAGTYTKSFYTVMMAPSCTQIWLMGPTAKRFHHQIKWDHAVPKILSPRHSKAGARDG